MLAAAQRAIANPLLNMSIHEAEAVLFSVKGGSGLTVGAVNAAGELISKCVKRSAAVYFGMSIDRTLGDHLKLTLIATGLREAAPKDSLGSLSTQGQPPLRICRLTAPWGRAEGTRVPFAICRERMMNAAFVARPAVHLQPSFLESRVHGV